MGSFEKPRSGAPGTTAPIDDGAETRALGRWRAMRTEIEDMKPLSDGDAEELREKKAHMPFERSAASDLAEAVVAGAAEEWLSMPSAAGTDAPPSARAEAYPTIEFDDVMNGSDVVVRIGPPGGPPMLWLAIDVTREHPDNATSAYRLPDSRRRVREKIEKSQNHIRPLIKRDADRARKDYGGRRDAGHVKYGLDHETTMPRAVISLPDSLLKELAKPYSIAVDTLRSDEETKRNALNKLREHPARREFLAQILIAMKAEASLLRSEQRKVHPADIPELEAAARRAEYVATYVRGLLGGDYEPENGWLKEDYAAFGRLHSRR